MPDIPNVPGVPSLSSFSTDSIVMLLEDAVLSLGLFADPIWGIFGIPPILYNSIVSFEYRRDFTISDYPVEQGGFQSYDKVELPFDVKVRIASGPSPLERRETILSLDFALASLALFAVVTPEKVYLSVNMTHVDYVRRADNGVGVIVADVWFTQVRQTSTTEFVNTQEPAGQAQQQLGNVQPQAATGAPLSIGLSNLDPNRIQIH